MARFASIRDDSVNLSRQTTKRLWLIAKATAPTPVSGSDEGRKVTGDEIAEKLLTEVIEQRYPQIIECEKAIEAAEESFKKSMQSPAESSAARHLSDAEERARQS